MLQQDVLARLSAVIESRKPEAGGNPDTSYVARLLHKGPDAFLKKIGEEATEVVMAAKDAEHQPGVAQARETIVAELADLWGPGMVARAHCGRSSADGGAALARREGLSGIEEKALRKARERSESTQGGTHA